VKIVETHHTSLSLDEFHHKIFATFPLFSSPFTAFPSRPFSSPSRCELFSMARNFTQFVKGTKARRVVLGTFGTAIYLYEDRLGLLRRQIQDFLLCLAEFGCSFVVLFLFLLHAADRVFSEGLQGNHDLIVRPVELKVQV
jgi:hypothetical protein